MSDIVERLREEAARADYDAEEILMTDAADTITALRAENERLRAALAPFARMGRELLDRQRREHGRTAVIHTLGTAQAIMVSDLYAAARAAPKENER